ncbi:MAG: hypothetical protein IAF38_14260 [Bacteroidia bacterium]|nr:hypothetical protein [Bacteroidia bacterium]
MIGHSSYRIKKQTPGDLEVDLVKEGVKLKQRERVVFYDPLFNFFIRLGGGLTLDNAYVLKRGQACSIEKRQRFFWMWGIPMFPVGTFWCVRLKEGKSLLID